MMRVSVYAVVVTVVAACGAPPEGAPPPPRDAPASVAMDTLRGTVTLVGAAPAARPVVRVGPQTVALRFPEGQDVARLTRLDLWLQGEWQEDGRVFRVRHFIVRAVDGRSVADGVLRRDGARYWLERTEGGRVAVPAPSAALRRHVGDRIWITEPVEDGGGRSFGLIRRAPPS